MLLLGAENMNLFIFVNILYLSLHFIASLTVTPLLWGVDSWRYLPGFFPWLLLGIGCCACIPALQNRIKSYISHTMNWSQNVPSIFWLVAGACIMFFFREKTFLLGDGRLRIHNAETGYFFSAEEPLDTFIHTLLYKLLYPFLHVTGEQIYMGISIVCGVIFLWFLRKNLNALFETAGERLLVGGMIILSGSVQLFFGYAESYTLMAALAILFLLYSLVMLKEERFSLKPILFLSFACITHPLAGVMLPGAVYAYLFVMKKEFYSGGMTGFAVKNTTWFLAPILVLVFGFWAGGFPPSRFIEAYLRGGNMLPLLSANGTYGLFSLAHGVDIANELFLIAPGLVALSLFFHDIQKIKLSPEILFLLLCSLGALFFMCAFHMKLGFARDWDFFALVAFPLLLLTGMIVVKHAQGGMFGIGFTILVISLLHTAPWIFLNSSESCSLNRMQNLLGTPSWSPATKALALDELAGFYADTGRIRESITASKQAYYLTGNIRCFRNVVNGYYALKETDGAICFLKTAAGRDSLNPMLHYAMGQFFLKKQFWQEAVRELEKTLSLDSDYPEARSQLGTALSRSGLYDRALEEYRKAIERETGARTPVIWNNIGYVYGSKGMWVEAAEAFRKAVLLKHDYAEARFNLAQAYFMLGNITAALEEAALAVQMGYDRNRADALLLQINSAAHPSAGQLR